MASACPPDYGYSPEALARPPDLTAETLYVIGGLYGNPHALAAIAALREAEQRAGRPVTLVFNGDFHWFDVQAGVFRDIGAAVLEHSALRGNVEAELARVEGSQVCGCAYPDTVERAVAERSDAIFRRLSATAAGEPEHRARLRSLPLHLVAQVGGQRIAILHGDPESLSGWRLSEEALVGLDRPSAGDAAPQTGAAQVADWFRRADADAFATTHTCLPFARDLAVDGRPRVIVNNGAAGMPNFHRRRFGLLTRISARPEVPPESLYGIAAGGVRYDALPIHYDQEQWLGRFLADWPPGSPAHRSYFRRIAEGPVYTLSQAVRGAVSPYPQRRTA